MKTILIIKNRTYLMLSVSIYTQKRWAGNLVSVSGLVAFSNQIRQFLSANTSDAMHFRKVLADHIGFHIWSLYNKPITDIETLYNAAGHYFLSRPFDKNPLLMYPNKPAKYHHGFHYHMPTSQHLFAASFVGRGYDFNDFPKKAVSFDMTSFNTINKKPLAVTTLTEAYLMQRVHGYTLQTNSNVKGVLINPDNFHDKNLQNFFLNKIKQKNPEGYLSLMINTNTNKIVPQDVKLYANADKALSWTIGHIGVSPHLDFIQAMMRCVGDFGTCMSQTPVSALKLLEEPITTNWRTTVTTNIIKKKGNDLLIKYQAFEQEKTKYLLHPQLGIITPSTILSAEPNVDFINFVAKDPIAWDQTTDKIAVIIATQSDILFPPNQAIDAVAFQRVFIEIMKTFPPSLQRDLIDHYLTLHQLLLKY